MVAIVISEINLIKDYIILTNNTNNAINLRNWRLIDTTPTNQKRHEFIFKKDFSLAADAEVKIWSGIGKDNANNIYQNRKAPIWNNPGDTATLYDSFGNEVDSKTVGKPPNKSKGGRGVRPPKLPPPPKLPTKIKISGFVNDSICGQGIKAHLVFESLKGQETIETDSDKTGNYKTELTTGRDYTVTVSAKNYDDFPDTINTKAGKDMTKDFKLNPNLEIELDVDSTEVRFTRKDDNKINTTQELKDKIVVDFNTDYTFNIKTSIQKGLTNEIKATLLENNKNPNNKLNEGTDKACRTSDVDKTLVVGFNPIKQRWDWFKLGWFWYIDWNSLIKEKSFDYSVSLYGKYGNNQFGPKPFPLGRVIIKINKEKEAYLKIYDILNDLWWRTGVSALVAGILTVLAPPLILILGSAAAALAFLWELEGKTKDDLFKLAQDPPKFDINYKKIIKLRGIKKANVKGLSLLVKAIVLTRDRLYSAHTKKDKSAIKKQLANINSLLKEYVKTNKTMLNLVKSSIVVIEDYKKYFDIKTVSQIRKAIRQKKISKSLVMPKLKQFGMSKKQIDSLFKLLNRPKIKDKNLVILSKLRYLKRTLLNLNRIFAENILREVKWYSKI